MADLLNKEYHGDRKLKVTTNTANNVTFTTEGKMVNNVSVLGSLAAPVPEGRVESDGTVWLVWSGVVVHVARLFGEYTASQDNHHNEEHHNKGQ